MDASDVGTDLKEVLIPAERLQARVTELAAQIDRDYAGRELLLVGVLKGAVMIMADLARAMHLPVQMDWMAVSSYGSGHPVLRGGAHPQGPGHRHHRQGRAGRGGHRGLRPDPVLAGRQPAVARAGLGAGMRMLRKPAAARMDVDVAYTGFDIENEFVIGYGLDYAERYRNLPFIGTLAPHVYKDDEPSDPGHAAAARRRTPGPQEREQDQRSGALTSAKAR